MPNCFIMMPISTPEGIASAYGNDKEHFLHVLEHLFVPAVEKAGYEPIRPVTQGAEVIQAHIIRSIQTADLVLCDISSLNANVFFELGIRTALNLPAIITRDTLTKSIPFDTGIINHHTYDGSLSPWTLPIEIEKLIQHIVSTANSSGGHNPLWKYFGLSTAAQPVSAPTTADEKLDYAIQLIESIKEPSPINKISEPPPLGADVEHFIEVAKSMAASIKAQFTQIEIDGRNVLFDLGPYLLTEELEKAIYAAGEPYGVLVKITGTAWEQIKAINPKN